VDIHTKLGRQQTHLFLDVLNAAVDDDSANCKKLAKSDIVQCLVKLSVQLQNSPKENVNSAGNDVKMDGFNRNTTLEKILSVIECFLYLGPGNFY